MASNKQTKVKESFIIPKAVEQTSRHISDDVYDDLPRCLLPLLKIATNNQERDALLLGSITVISGCLPNVCGFYDRHLIYPNLFAFFDAPAGSGKGVLNFLRYLGDPIHKSRLSQSNDAIDQYQKELKAAKKEGKEPEGMPPARRLLFIPANNSASSFIQTLNENEGGGILFSTEADTLANSLSQDWGNFSDILRNAFHHETVELQRRTGREYIQIENPRLSVLLTGTKGQLRRLIPNTENGLFSRFMYYSMRSIPQFRDVFAPWDTVPGQSYRDMGQQIHQLYSSLEKLESPMKWKVPPELRPHFSEFYGKLLKSFYHDVGERITPTVKRTALIAFRIAMVLSSLRYFLDHGNPPTGSSEIFKEDLRSALKISGHLLLHSSIHMTDMPGHEKQTNLHQRKQKFTQALPKEFSKKKANGVGSKQGISPASVSRFLLSGPFEKVSHGHYRKITE